MTADREQFIVQVRAYVAAGERLAEGVSAFNAMNTEALDDLLDGMTLSESFALRDSAAWSRRISRLLDEYEACRRRTRHLAATILLEEGRTVTDVGRAFGVSHQWASRMIREREDGDGDGHQNDQVTI